MRRYFKELYQLLGNRRKGERIPIEGQVNATWKNQYGQLRTRACTCVDVSVAGLAVLCEEPANVTTDVFLYSSAHGLKTFAAVRHCTPDAGGYRIGFKFRAEPAVWDGF